MDTNSANSAAADYADFDDDETERQFTFDDLIDHGPQPMQERFVSILRDLYRGCC